MLELKWLVGFASSSYLAYLIFFDCTVAKEPNEFLRDLLSISSSSSSSSSRKDFYNFVSLSGHILISLLFSDAVLNPKNEAFEVVFVVLEKKSS